MKNLTEENIRVDKWLWATRIFKTRSMASTACKNKQVSIDKTHVKPSRTLKIGDIIEVKKPPIVRHYLVKGLLAKRQSAKVVVDYIEDITPESELAQLELIKFSKGIYRDKGLGRPTKKDRRNLEDFGYL